MNTSFFMMMTKKHPSLILSKSSLYRLSQNLITMLFFSGRQKLLKKGPVSFVVQKHQKWIQTLSKATITLIMMPKDPWLLFKFSNYGLKSSTDRKNCKGKALCRAEIHYREAKTPQKPCKKSSHRLKDLHYSQLWELADQRSRSRRISQVGGGSGNDMIHHR